MQKKPKKSNTIFDIIIYLLFLFNLISVSVFWWQGKLTYFDSILFNTIVFGFLITWRNQET